MKKIIYISFVVAIGLFASCNSKQNSHGHSHDVIGGHNDDHAHEAGTLSYTLFTDNYELFVEFPALSVGQTSTFTAHFTELSAYKPVSDGKVTVSLIKGDKGIRHRVDAPASPGIFKPSLQPKEAGSHQMLFELETSKEKVSFEISQVQVFANADEAAHAPMEEADGDAISFLKEQAWKTDFAIQEVNLQAFYSVIHSSAKVGGQPQSSVLVNSQAEGQVNLFAVMGQSVKKGDLLALVTGSGIENNINIKLSENKIAFEKSKMDYIRTKPLVESHMVSNKDFLQIESQYKRDSLRYYQLAKQVSQQGLRITSPIDGFVSAVNVNNGQFINNGASLLNVSSRNKLLIEAYVNQSDFEKVNGIFDANFTYGDTQEAITLQELEGKVVSNNAFVNSGITRIPVSFSGLNNGQLMPGMYVEAFLKTGKKENALVIPLSSIVEEQGQYYAFVQKGGESFVKRQIEIANSDGIRTEVISGLKVGERIVTQGAYQIKLAAMAGDLPLHGHTH